MTAHYVRTNGNDGGSGHDGSTPALAWLTIAYAVAHVSAGDTIWVGGGTYRISAAIAPATMASMTYLRADVTGANTGDAGEVVVTGYSSDTSAPNAIMLFNFTAKNFWTVAGFTLVAGTDHALYVTTTSHDLDFADLTVFGYKTATKDPIRIDSLTWGTQAANITIERCRIWGSSNAVYVLGLPASASGSDLDQNIVVRNCVLLSPGNGVRVTGTNATKKSGGVRLFNNLIVAGTCILSSDSFISTTYPTTAANNVLLGSTGWTGTTATTADSYNFYHCGTAQSNVTQGTGSISDGSRPATFHMGQSAYYGAKLRPFGQLTAGSPLLDWGDGAAGAVTDDALGGMRPGHGGASVTKAAGPFERNDVATRELSITHTGGNSAKIAGPGYQDLALPVDAVPTTVSVYGYYDANYAGTLPQLLVANGGECGVSDASVTLTGSAATWTKMQLSFTPTAAGIVTIRLQSNCTAATGCAYFDDLGVAV